MHLRLTRFRTPQMKRVCYEVKTSRADFLSELKQPLKRRIGMRYSNEFYFVTPVVRKNCVQILRSILANRSRTVPDVVFLH